MFPIDPSKVVVIFNTNPAHRAVSEAVADYYIAARGLNPAYKLGDDFGTSWQYGSVAALKAAIVRVVTLMMQLQATGGVEAVVTSSRMPVWVAGPLASYFGQFEYSYATRDAVAFFAGGAWGFGANVAGDSNAVPGYSQSDTVTETPQELRSYRRGVANSPENRAFGDYRHVLRSTGSNVAVRGTEYLPLRVADVARRKGCRPNGRLGTYYPNTPGGLSNETFEDAKRIIDDSIANEGAHLHTGKKGLFGCGDRLGQMSTDYGYYRMTARGVQNAREWAEMVGLTGYEWYGSIKSMLPNVGGLPKVPVSRQINATTLKAGGLNPKLDVFCWNGCALTNPWTAAGELSHPYINSLNVLPGAFAYENTSFGYMVGIDFQRRGGSTFVGALQEPGANGPPSNEAFQMGVSLGLTMAQAGLIGYGNEYCSVVGDPLYRPFKNSPIKVNLHEGV